MNEWDSFDRALSDAVGDLPPSDSTVKSITPWGHCMEQVILGLILTSFTLNFLWLQYLLPAVAVANLYLAFRTLRGNNRYFRVCWWLSGLKVGLLTAGTLLAATPLVNSGVGVWLLGYPNAVTTFLLYFFFRLGLRQAAKDLGQTPASDPMLGALVWYSVLLVLAVFLPDGGWLIGIPVVTAFIVIVKLLTEVVQDLDTWGYQVQAAPVRISAEVWRRWFYGGLLALTALLTLFFAHQPPQDRYIVPPIAQETTRQELTTLGFPAELLDRLPDEEVLRMQDADFCSFSPDSRQGGHPNGGEGTHLQFDTVYVRIAPLTYRVYEFFRLEETTPRSCFQNTLLLSPDGDFPAEDLDCRIFWTQGERRMGAAVETFSFQQLAWFGRTFAKEAARFSYPFFSDARDGYMACTVRMEETRGIFCSLLDYSFPQFYKLYPYPTLETATQSNGLRTQSYSTCYVPEYAAFYQE